MATDNTLIVGLFTASTTMAGGMWLASRPRRWLTHARLAAIMALGAGLLLAVLFFELLPAALQGGQSSALNWLFGGVLSVLIFERYLAPHLNFIGQDQAPTACSHPQACQDHAEADDHDAPQLLSHGAACSALGCLLVCTFFDGVAMAAGFALEFHVGLLVMLGLLAHILPEGMLAAAVVLAAGSSHRLARRAALATGVAFLLGLALPLALGGATGTLTYALPLASGVLLYVVLAQLIPVALRTPSGVPLVVAGALLFGLVERLMPHAH